MDNLSESNIEPNGAMAESETSNLAEVEKSGKRIALRKPFKTIDEQIEILNARGLQTDNDTRYILEREGYYPVINGYKDFFHDSEATVKNGNDVYLSDVTFNDVYRLFSFDRDLRTTFMRYFAMAEAALKTVCAYKFTEAHAGEKNPYMNVANYRAKYQKKGKALDLIEEFGKAIGRDRENGQWRKKTYLRHYVEDHDGEVPLWVLMNFATLGQAFRFYCFMEEGMQNEVAKVFSGLYEGSYGIPKRIYPKMLRRPPITRRTALLRQGIAIQRYADSEGNRRPGIGHPQRAARAVEGRGTGASQLTRVGYSIFRCRIREIYGIRPCGVYQPSNAARCRMTGLKVGRDSTNETRNSASDRLPHKDVSGRCCLPLCLHLDAG